MSQELKQELKQLQKDCNWLSIYEKFNPIVSIKDNSEIWNNDEILSIISYSSAKLSETSINLKWTFNTDDERNKFLSQQKNIELIQSFLENAVSK